MGLTRTLLVAGAGAALAYFLDPVSGKERREKVRDYWNERVQGAKPMEVDEPSPTVVVEKPATRPASAK
ncbi:MAG TPA: hypothetical protein VE953_26915 [Terriglobales bacterium]|nr:hypothetical protein [Terriglobales bacterium]